MNAAKVTRYKSGPGLAAQCVSNPLDEPRPHYPPTSGQKGKRFFRNLTGVCVAGRQVTATSSGPASPEPNHVCLPSEKNCPPKTLPPRFSREEPFHYPPLPMHFGTNHLPDKKSRLKPRSPPFWGTGHHPSRGTRSRSPPAQWKSLHSRPSFGRRFPFTRVNDSLAVTRNWKKQKISSRAVFGNRSSHHNHLRHCGSFGLRALSIARARKLFVVIKCCR